MRLWHATRKLGTGQNGKVGLIQESGEDSCCVFDLSSPVFLSKNEKGAPVGNRDNLFFWSGKFWF